MTFTVVSGSSVSEDDGNGQQRANSSIDEPKLDAEGNTTTEEPPSKGKKTYVVEPGDTLSSIALETGVPLSELEALNPDIDPQALSAGEELKLR